MTETTEKISTEDLVLLVEKVMGWRQSKYLPIRDVGDVEQVYTLHSDGSIYIGTEKWSQRWAPTRDGSEGLWQAKQLLKALKAEGWESVWFSENRGEVIRLYRDDSTHEHEVLAPTLPLAITWAVLAAAKGAEDV